LLGSTRGIDDNINFYRDVHKKALTVIGAHEACRPQKEESHIMKTIKTDDTVSLNFIAQKRLEMNMLISEVFEPANAQSAYDRLFERDPLLMLVAFKWAKE